MTSIHSALPLTTLPLHLCIPSKLASPIVVLQLGSILPEFYLHQFNFSIANFSTYSEQCGIQIIILIKILLPYPIYTASVPLIILNMAGYFFSMRCVASPPSSRIMFGCQFSAFTHLSIHHQKSSSVSPRHENMEKPDTGHQKSEHDVTHIKTSQAITMYWDPMNSACKYMLKYIQTCLNMKHREVIIPGYKLSLN